MEAEVKKTEINWDHLRGKKLAIKKAKKIFQEGEEGEDEILVYKYFVRR